MNGVLDITKDSSELKRLEVLSAINCNEPIPHRKFATCGMYGRKRCLIEVGDSVVVDRLIGVDHDFICSKERRRRGIFGRLGRLLRYCHDPRTRN